MDATEEEMTELTLPGGILFVAGRALKKLFQPDRFNWETLGNVWEHLHTHIIPRYRSERTALGLVFRDNYWGKPRSHEEKDRCILTPEQLLQLRDMLRKEIAEWYPNAVPSL